MRGSFECKLKKTHDKDYVESLTKPNSSTADDENRAIISISTCDTDLDGDELGQQEVDGRSMSSHSSESNTDNPISSFSRLCSNAKQGNAELSVYKWDECETEVVAKLPWDINGLQRYKIICNVGEAMMVSRDGRPWQTWTTSSRKYFSGIR